jgi:hypothetical protein
MGTRLPKQMPEECPQPAEADVRPLDGNSRFDPEPTLAVHCGNGFDADFSPYPKRHPTDGPGGSNFLKQISRSLLSRFRLIRRI